MKNLSLVLIVVFCLAACSTEETNLSINGAVQGLKKGTLYLQTIEDTNLVTIDSVVMQGDPNFNFEIYLENPRVMHLYLNKVDGTEYDDRIQFFAEPGEMTINTSLENFEIDAVVEGSVNQQKLMEYRKMMKQFNSRNLGLIQANLEAQQQENQEAIDSTNEAYESLIKRRYLYTVNFALNNKDLELAPYLAMSEVYDANLKYLDTIYKSLTPEIRESEYGKNLQTFLEERRELEESVSEGEATTEENS